VKTIAYFFISLTLLPTIISCSHESNTVKNDTADFKTEVNHLIDDALLIQDELSKSRNPIEDIDQETLDYYASLLGYDPGIANVEDVNQLIEHYGIATEEGLMSFLDQYPIDEVTKQTLDAISKGNWIENLNTVPGFSELDISEKEIIQFANTFVIESENRFGCGVGAFIGIIIGGFICTPICHIIGAIIGCWGGKQ
jgi:hypothetical protein